LTTTHSLDKGEVKRHELRPGGGRPSIDDIDRKLLAELMRDSRRSFRDLARTVNVSTTTAVARVKRLEELGIAKGYFVQTDHQKLGYELTAVTEIVASKGRLLEMEQEISKLPGVCAVYDVTGDTDGIVIAKFRDRESLSAFTKGLLSLPFVERTNTHVVLTTVKEDFRLPPVQGRTT
jgi:DNA-binding Lrp family transcriptional regulator